MDDTCPPATENAYPFREVVLEPNWTSRRAQSFAAIAFVAGAGSIAARLPLTLDMIHDVALRNILPAGLAFVLAFAPVPTTTVGRIAKDLTGLALAASCFAGNYALLMLALYPFLLAASVLIGSTPAGERLWRVRQ